MTRIFLPVVAALFLATGTANADAPREPGLFASPDRLLYFAAAVPTVGFVHGAADLNPLDEAASESNVEITERRRGIPFLHRHAFWLAA